jgi:hypothetical protein
MPHAAVPRTAAGGRRSAGAVAVGACVCEHDSSADTRCEGTRCSHVVGRSGGCTGAPPNLPVRVAGPARCSRDRPPFRGAAADDATRIKLSPTRLSHTSSIHPFAPMQPRPPLPRLDDGERRKAPRKACTPGRSHAAAPAHTSPASRTRKIKDEELLKSAAHDAPVDCSPVRRARHADALDSGRTGRYVAADVSSAPRAGRTPPHRVAPRPTRILQKC